MQRDVGLSSGSFSLLIMDWCVCLSDLKKWWCYRDRVFFCKDMSMNYQIGRYGRDEREGIKRIVILVVGWYGRDKI